MLDPYARIGQRRFMIAPSLDVFPVSELADDIRKRLPACPGGFALTRPRSRSGTRIVDAAFAELLERFRAPRTITEAVIDFSRARGSDPTDVLTNAYPIIHQLINDCFLIAEDASASVEYFRAGDEVAGFTIIRAVQLTEDVQVFLAQAGARWAAVKVGTQATAALLAREADILRELHGAVAPRLLASGEDRDPPYVVMEWCDGADPQLAAEELRALPTEESRPALLRLATAITDAYVALHAAGIAHGDVHPRNIVVARDGTVRLLDFGYARRFAADGDDHRPPRAGVPFFMEPEYAAASLRKGAPPPASSVSDQFGLAALIYTLFTGSHHQEYSLESTQMLEQLARPKTSSFRERGVPPWPVAERALRAALAQSPRRRPASVAAFRDALIGSVSATPVVGRKRIAPSGPTMSPRLRGLVANALAFAQSADPRAVLETFPTCAVHSGAGGIAYAMYRAAVARASGELLALADLWAERAVAWTDRADAFGFSNTAFEPPERRSLYHGVGGVHCVRGLVAAARGDSHTFDEAVAGFLAASAIPGVDEDLTLGACGTALGCAVLLDSGAGPESDARRALLDLARRRLDDLQRLSETSHVGDGTGPTPLGIAHGWAGYLFATLRVSAAMGRAAPASVRGRIDELLLRREPEGRGALWPWLNDFGDRIVANAPGWCNGSAGMTMFLLAAHREYGDDRYAAMAEAAAWFAWEDPDDGPDICCGLAGRAYSLLELYRATGDRAWLRRATTLANRAAASPEVDAYASHNLFKGALGVALLGIHLEHPETAAVPTFETGDAAR